MKLIAKTTILLSTIITLCACFEESEWAGNLYSADVQFTIASIGGLTETADVANTRSESFRPQSIDTIDLGEDYAILAETFEIPKESFEEQDKVLTRGTPLQEARQISSMNVMAFSATGALLPTTPLYSIVTATLTNGNWNNNKGLSWPSQTAQLSFFAVAPAATADNGMTLSDDGRVLTYTAPDMTAKQPDICWASPIINRTNPDNSGNHLISFNMKHRLAAVGLMAMGNYLKISKVTLGNVFSSGKLSMETGEWSDIGTKKTFDMGVVEQVESTVMTDVTKSNGYVMLPPQIFNNDAMLTIVFDDLKNEKINITRTIRLKTYTDGKWGAGKLVLYKMIFKGKYPLTVTPYEVHFGESGGMQTISYTTTSPMPVTLDTDVAWIKSLQIDEENKKISFTCDNTSESRTGNIYVSTGYTTVKVPVTQVDPKIDILEAPPTSLPYDARILDIYVYSTTLWGIKSSTHPVWLYYVGPGKGEASVGYPSNPSYINEVIISVTFTTKAGYGTEDTETWTAKQKYRHPEGYYDDHLLDDEVAPGLFLLADENNMSQNITYSNAKARCSEKGGRLPTIKEAQAMVKNKHLFPNLSFLTSQNNVWTSSSIFVFQKVVNFGSNMSIGAVSRTSMNLVRCVRRENE